MQLFNHYSGDTWHGLTLTVSQSGVPLNISGASLAMEIRKAPGTPILYEWSTDDSTIALTDPANGKLTVNPRIIDLPSGVYPFDLEMALGETVTTLIYGTFTITADITKR